MDVIKVEKVTIRIKDVILDLSVEEAKELRNKLSELLGDNHWHWHTHSEPWTVNTNPPYVVTSGSSGDTNWMSVRPYATSEWRAIDMSKRDVDWTDLSVYDNLTEIGGCHEC